MLFNAPIRFKEAIRANKARGLLPVSEDTGSAELQRIRPEIRQRAVFSARTRHVSHLAKIQELTDKLLGPPADPLQRVSKADARQELRASLAALNYSPDQVGAAPGSLRDLASSRRLNLILDHNVREARGFGRHVQGQQDAVLRIFPAQELVRVHARKEPRTDWPARFRAAGGHITDDGRMMALKNTPVWTLLNRFGNAWPPFDFMSGMGLRDVRRDVAIREGLLKPGERVQPDSPSLNRNAEASVPPTTGDLQDAIRTQLGRDAQIDETGTLRITRTVHPRVGQSGDAKTWNLPLPAPTRPPPQMDVAVGKRLVAHGLSVVSPLGESVTIGSRLLRHNANEAGTYDRRLRQLNETVEAVREADEVWLQEGKRNEEMVFVKHWKGRKGPRTSIVVVDVPSGEIYTAFYSPKAKKRSGRLLYATYKP